MEYIWTNNIEDNSYKDGLKIRWEVFVIEQKVPEELEIDEKETQCQHLTIYDNGRPLATGRIFPYGEKTAKFERVAVAQEQRGAGLGRFIMEEMERKAKEMGCEKAILGGQTVVIPFYEKLGYSAYGEEFMDAGIPHKMLKKEIL